MKLYVIGVGPGDPELITLKGKRLLERLKLLFYPSSGKETLALSIVEKILPVSDKKLVELHFPMKRDESLREHWMELAEIIKKELEFYQEGAFITLGDPSFYATFFYLKPFLQEGEIEIEVIPGISSFSALSAKLTLPLTLGREEAVITTAENLIKNFEKFVNFNTLVIMKGNRHFNEIREWAKTSGYEGYVGKRIGQEGERLWKDLTQVSEEELDYFSTILLKKKKGN